MEAADTASTTTDSPSARFVAFVVAYDGTNLSGSQRQNNARSVQGELEKAIETVFGEKPNVALSGRTDAGVHATGQVGRFKLEHPIPVERVPLALNRVLDPAIRVLRAWDVEESFHPRFSAKSRVYRYAIDNAPIASPMLHRFAGHVRDTLDAEAMQNAANAFLGERDFAAWQSAGSPPKGGTTRTVYRCEVTRRVGSFGHETIEVEIEANGFLYQMVRNIVGALIEVGRDKLDTAAIEQLFAGRDRTKCPPPAAGQGLCLVEVKY